MAKTKFFNDKILLMMIKENIQNNKKIFLSEDKENQLIFNDSDYLDIMRILNDKLSEKDNISIDDIDESIDNVLFKKGYIYDDKLENRYRKTTNGNFYYFEVVELELRDSAKTIDELIFKLSNVVKSNHKKLSRSTKVIDDLVNINILKDNSTRFNLDEKKAYFKAGFNLKTDNFIFNFLLEELTKI